MSNCFYAHAGYKTIILYSTIRSSLSFKCSDYDQAIFSSFKILVEVVAMFEILAGLEMGKYVAEGLDAG
jgi:hypothetical protein